MPDDQAETNGRSTVLQDPGTTAVLHGMLSTLSEALEHLDGRLGRLEKGIGATSATATEVGRELSRQRRSVEEVLSQLQQPSTGDEQVRDLIARLGRGQLELANRLDALAEQVAAAADTTAAEVLRRADSMARSVDTLADDVSGFARGVEQRLEGIAEHVQAPRPVESLLEQRLDVLAQHVATVCERSEGWRRSELVVAERLDVLGARLEEVAARVEAPRPAEAAVAERLEEVGARLEELAARVEALGVPDTELERRLGEVLDEVRRVGAAVAAVATRGATSAELGQAVEHVVGEIGRQIGGVSPALGDGLVRILDPVVGRWEDLARSVDAAALTLAGLAEQVDGLRSDAASQREAASDVEAVVATVVGALSDLRSALGNRPEELVELVTDVREQVGQLGARPDAARAVARYTAAVAERVDNHVTSLLEAVDAAAGRAATAGTAELRAVGEATARLEQTVQAWVDNGGRRQEAVAEGLAAIAGRATEQHEVLQALLERLATVEALSAADGGQANADLLERHRAAWQADLDRLQAGLRSALADVSGRASSVAAVVGALDGRVHGLLESVRAVGGAAHAAAQVRSLVEALRQEVEELRVLQIEHAARAPRG